MAITRTITFYWNDLPQHVRIVLCFQARKPRMFSVEQEYVAWKSIICRAGHGSATVSYSGRIAISQSEVDSGDIVTGTIYQEIPFGSITRLEKGEDGYNRWGESKKDSSIGTLIKARNTSGMRQDISFGTLSADRKGFTTYEPVFVWKGVGTNVAIETDFYPNLMAFVGMHYQQGQVMLGDLSDETPIWSQSLSRLPNKSHWLLGETDQGGFQITAVV